MLGLALACGGARALNHVLDRDIDRLMGEPHARAPGRRRPRHAAPRSSSGSALSALSFALLARAVNLLTAVLALVGNLFYVFVYTRWLKRTTPQNIVIGGAAGAVPPLVGCAAATGNLALPALWLFLIVFLWTPPHFWALALMIKELRGGAGADAAGRARRPRDGAPDPALLARARRVHARRRALARAGLHRRGASCSAPPSSARGGCYGATNRAARGCCSTTRWPTWRCCSLRRRSTRC